MAYYITPPDLLLVEIQLGMMRPIPVPNILLMNLYNQLMLCAKIWIFFLKYWGKYEQIYFYLKCPVTRNCVIPHKCGYVGWQVLISFNTLPKIVIIGQSVIEISQNKGEIMKFKKKNGLLH